MNEVYSVNSPLKRELEQMNNIQGSGMKSRTKTTLVKGNSLPKVATCNVSFEPMVAHYSQTRAHHNSTNRQHKATNNQQNSSDSTNNMSEAGNIIGIEDPYNDLQQYY